jgi:hypothetical protein
MFTWPWPNTVHQVLFTLNQPSQVTVLFIKGLAILTPDPKLRAGVLFNSYMFTSTIHSSIRIKVLFISTVHLHVWAIFSLDSNPTGNGDLMGILIPDITKEFSPILNCQLKLHEEWIPDPWPEPTVAEPEAIGLLYCLLIRHIEDPCGEIGTGDVIPYLNP